ncbi:hypothetical protein AAHA92_04169 [Salvia divinorum]|uniref:KIB1-4 beta-propeller domain-containing protein n=1 Tax=Salvia divinorum TaxID=28513 RepID=A0ABD1HYB9_SALDI
MASSILQSSIFCGMKVMSNAAPPPPPRKLSSPCLILPSSYEAGYKKLYSLAEKKVVSIEKAAPPPPWTQGGRVKHVGCSHGWVASFNEDNGQTFLFDPITGCHIKLPDIDRTTWPKNIILSSSPDTAAARSCGTTVPAALRSAPQPTAAPAGSPCAAKAPTTYSVTPPARTASSA